MDTRFGRLAGALSVPRRVVVALVQAPRVASIHAGQDGSVELRWEAVIGPRCRIEFKNAARAKVWQMLYDGILADRSPMDAEDTLGGAAIRYWRIVKAEQAEYLTNPRGFQGHRLRSKGWRQKFRQVPRPSVALYSAGGRGYLCRLMVRPALGLDGRG